MKKFFHQYIVFLYITIFTLVFTQAQAQTYRVLPLGNSITVGWNGAVPPMDEAISFRDTLFEQLTTEGYLFDFVGHTTAGSVFLSDPEHGAISGFRGQDVLRMLQDGYDDLNNVPITTPIGRPYLDQYPADIILLHIGTNDISEGEAPSADDVEAILDEIDLWELSSGNPVTVFVARIIDRTDSPLLSFQTQRYNDSIDVMLADRADPDVFVVDMEEGAGIDYGTEMDGDGVHPLQSALDKMGVGMYTTMDDYLSLLPLTPETFSLGGETSSSIQLSWSDLSSNETGFEIERSLTGLGGEFSLVHTTGTDATSYNDTGLEDEILYYYRIRAINGDGPSLYTSIESTSTLMGLPAAPSTLANAGVTASSVSLTWSDNSDNESGFEIQRSTTGLPFSYVSIFTASANATSYTNTGLNEATTYYYRVRAINLAGESGYSNVVSATTSLSPPAAPTGLSAGSITASTVEMSWTDVASNETNYIVQRSTNGVAYSNVQTLGANITTWTDTGRPDNTTYYYRVYARNGAGSSTYSNVLRVTTLLAIPDAPDNLAVEGFTATSIEISWDDNSDNESGFEIERAPGSSPASFTLIHTTGIGSTGYDDTGLDELTTYYYRVRAINLAGESSYSNVVSATTALGMPAAPTGLTEESVTSSSVEMSWTDVATNESNYIVQRSLNGGSYTTVRLLPANTTSWTDTGRDDNTTYYYRVYARNATGNSSYSNVLNVTTLLAAPDDPTTLIITGVNTNSITMMWSDQSDNELGFQIERSIQSGSGFSVVGNAAADEQTFTNIGLSDNTTYYYRVRAYNAAGFSGYTTEASATTTLSAPLPPSDLLLDNISDNSIDLNWRDNSANESGFEIERSLAPLTGYVRITTTTADVTSYTSTGLDQNTTYYYRVRAINPSGQSAYSNVRQGTTLLLLPDAPSDLAFTLVTENSMRIGWQDNSDNEANFEIQRSLTAGTGFVEVGTPTDSYFDDAGLDEDVEYFYRVRAVNNTGPSAWITGSQSTLLLLPSEPDRLSGVASSVCSVDLTWRDRSTNEDSFEVQRSSLPTSGFVTLQSLPPDTEEYTDITTENNTSYFYRIAAINTSGTVYSNVAVVTVSIALDGGLIMSDQDICPEGDPEAILNDQSPSGGSNSWTYQWQSRIAPGLFTDIPGAIAISYDPPANALLTTEYQRISTVECGSVASNVVVITVDDLEEPQFTLCPVDELIEIERDELVASVITTDPVFTDNCEVSSLTWTMSGATIGVSPDVGINLIGEADFALGITTLTYVAEDLAGNTGSCSFDISVKIKDPEVLNVSIPNATMKIDDIITATIEVSDDGGTEYILLSGDIGGYPLQNFVRLNSTTYLANFLIFEGGNSYEAPEDIPVGNLVLSDGLTPSLPYITPISQNNDLLDAQLPVVSIADVVEGFYKIGDRVVINILSDGTGYTINPASTVNGINVDEPNMRFVEMGVGYYQLIYTVLEGDRDIAPGDFVASLILEKPSGNTGEPYTSIGNVDKVEIDANAPVVERLEVPDEEVGVGGLVVVTITADGTGYEASSGTLINSVPISSSMVEFEEISNGLYTLSYEVSANDNVVDPGDLDMSIILRDSAGNIGQAYEQVEENELEVYTQLPLTHMVTLPEICEGEEAEIIIYLIGRKPFSIELFDGDTTLLYEDIDTSTYSVMVSPLENTTYSIPLITDKNGVENSGSGSVQIAVNESTPVKITNLQSGYSVETPPFLLTADTPGGIFSGPGVNSTTSYFSPAQADTVNSPHTLYYSYDSPTGCTSVDSALVFVLGAEGDIYIPSSWVCDNSEPFQATASNVAGVMGSFTLINAQDNEVAGLVDNGDNTAIIDPALLSDGTYTIEYAYFDEVMLYIRESFDLIYVIQPEILSPSGISSVCQNEDPIQLVANDPSAYFNGEGVIGNVIDGFVFDPALAPAGDVTISCVIYGDNSCEKSTELLLTVNSASEASFTINSSCMPEGGGLVAFNNLSTAKLSVETWRWDFGDPLSGADNYSSEIDPEHFYPYPGDWSISLTATTFDACVSVFELDTAFSSSPNSDFTWVSDCYLSDQGIEFVNLSTVGSTPLESMKWIFMDEAGDVLDEVISDSDTVEYQFPNAAAYLVGLQTLNQGDCSDTLTKSVDLRPTIKLDAEGYEEAFDVTMGEWTLESADDNSSWVWGTPDFEGYVPEAGNSLYTQLPDYGSGYVENSWIQSPCFDFSDMDRPMIKLDLMKSFVPNVNGVVLQYMDNREEGWLTIGSNAEGINWYNAFNIYNQPGGSPVGWGLDVFNPDTDWVEASQDLSSLKDKRTASLRLAIATNGAQGIGNQGFAFDNLMISEKTKLAVLEHFTNSSDENSFHADIQVDSYASNNRSEVVDIQYHTAYPGEDPMNQNNPGMVTTRAGNLGVGLVPYAVLDGGASEIYRYDFSSDEESPGSEELDLLSLSIPSFEIDLEVDWTETDLTAYTTVTCNVPSYTEYIQLFVVVMESLVTTYEGTNGDTEFRNVALDMLPTPSGKLLGENWYQGVSMNLTNQWTYKPYVEDVDDLIVVAFVQDRNTREILQTALSYKTTPTGIGDRYDEISELMVYPNPAKDDLYVNLGARSDHQGIMEVYDLSGRMVLNLETQPGYQIFSLDVQDLPRGMYLIRRFESGELVGLGKFVKTE